MNGNGKRRKIVDVAVGILIIFSFIALVPTANADSEHVAFHVDVYVADGYFSTDVSSTGDTVKPRETATITFNAQKGTASLYVDLGSYGGNTISFNTPLSSISIPVSGIVGLASVNVDLRGSLEGDLSVDGPGSISTNHLSWNSWGKKTVTLDASDAEDGDTITIRLNLKYTGHIGAHGDTALGDITIIPSQSLPGVQGSKSVVHTVKVQSGILPGLPGFEILTALLAVIVIFVLKKKIQKRNK